jgi:beta-glucosidase
MMAEAYRSLPVALERGLVTIDEIDECVLRVLRLKERLGLFDDPYRRGSTAEAAETIAARRRLAREAATKSLVLAKNSGGTLPLHENTRRVCVIGPLADAWREMRGPWAAAGYEEPSVTVLAGLREALPSPESSCGGTAISTDARHRGCSRSSRCGRRRPLPRRSEMTAKPVASSPVCPATAGARRAVLDRASRTGTPSWSCCFCRQPLIVPRLRRPTRCWSHGSGLEAGNAIADVLPGRAPRPHPDRSRAGRFRVLQSYQFEPAKSRRIARASISTCQRSFIFRFRPELQPFRLRTWAETTANDTIDVSVG